MIEKQLNYGEEARNLLLNGVNKMADAVKTTLGAAGRTVIIEDDFGRPYVTKDGVTVAKSISLSDPVENLGASVLRQASMKTADLAGDGTTTSVVIAQSMINTAFRLLMEHPELNVTKLRNELESLSAKSIDLLEKKSKKVTSKTLENVATISSNNDPFIGKIIADAYAKVGVDGAVTIEESMSSETYTTIVDGTRMKRGYHSPYLITDTEKNTVVLDKPLVFISDKKISTIEDIEPVLQVAIQNKRPIFIISDIETSVMNTLNVNKAKGILRVNVVAPEGVGLNRFELLEDLAIMTGSKVVSDDTGNDFSSIDADFLGFADKVLSTDKETVITLDIKSTAVAVENRAIMVRKTIEERKDESNAWHYKDRLSRLSGGIAAIHVGASTEVEMKEKKDRVEDAIFATRAALEQGIVAGGGIAFVNAFNSLSERIAGEFSDEFVCALEILESGMNAPFLQILKNADIHYSLEYYKPAEGIDVKTGKIGNMFKMGIIDPLKVSKNAVRNATSVVITLLTTSCVVSNKRA